jgi:site-specific recombinase XerD
MKMPAYTPVWNWRNAKNGKARYKVHICIYLNGNRRYAEVPTPLNVAKNEWDGKDNAWVKNTHPYGYEINQAIKQRIDLLTDLNKRYFQAKKSLTFPLIYKELRQNNNTHSFNQYFALIIKDPPEVLDQETMKRYHAALGNLNRFNSAVTFNDLSEDLFQKFKKYCIQDQELAGSTVNGYFNACKKVINWARKDNHISKAHEESIFEDVHIKVGKPKKDRLELDEITAWKNHDFKGKHPTQERDRNLFLIQIYTGFYYNDLRELLKTELKKDPEYGHYIQSGRYKNDNLAIVPLWKFKNGWPLIQLYLNKNPKDFYLFARDIFTEDQPYNRNLKRIAIDHLKWNRNVYNKLARSTNAQLYIRYGAKRPILSKMLGHEKEETASAYYEVNVVDVIEGTKEVNFDKFDI